METQSSAPAPSAHSNDDRTLAALAHVSPILNFVLGGVGGLLAAGAIWLIYKDKSKWVAFHGMQSLVFQLAQLITVLIVVGVPWAIGFAFSFITLGFGALLAVPIMIVVMFIGLALLFAGLIYSLYGAYQIYEGREFKYKWVGDWVERQMQSTSPPAA